jgi:hypothetical protein
MTSFFSGASPNKQLERTVIRRRVRAACASFHYAHAARWTRRRAAAQLRRYTARTPYQRPSAPSFGSTSWLVADIREIIAP